MTGVLGSALRAALAVTLLAVALVVALGVLAVSALAGVDDDPPPLDQDELDEWPEMTES